MKYILWIFAITLLISCEEESVKPKTGMWRATLEVQDEKILPFILEFKSDESIMIFNAEEEIRITDIITDGDSITITHPFFEGIFKGVFTEKTITGDFIKTSLDRIVPFKMTYGEVDRFNTSQTGLSSADGEWELIFSAHSDEDRYIAKGIFNQDNGIVTGTIRTTTGDYRYLEGVMDGNTMKLSTFDGAHAFLFEAEVNDSILYGFFYSGNHWKEPFSGKRNDNYELPDADSLTFLKEGYDRFEFEFPDTEGRIVSLNDERFKNKVVIVQIMGTWCPNCLEETKFYTEYLKNNPSQELEIVSLAIEYALTEEKAFMGINKLKKAIGVPYPILLAQYGSSDKEEANEKFPMLNHVISYPTTIFIDKSGKVRKIHTGFNGKATGETYVDFVNEFELFVGQLLNE